jgi:ABC-type Fe3+/spermidine/putrescine transport system ATPase subunit
VKWSNFGKYSKIDAAFRSNLEMESKDYMDKKVNDNGIVNADENEAIATSRRRFVKAAGKIAVYTPPAMILLMHPSAKTFAQSSGVGERRRRPRRHDNDHGDYDSDDGNHNNDRGHYDNDG